MFRDLIAHANSLWDTKKKTVEAAQMLLLFLLQIDSMTFGHIGGKMVVKRFLLQHLIRDEKQGRAKPIQGGPVGVNY